MDGERIRCGDRLKIVRGQRPSGLNVCQPRYSGIRKQAINFWKLLARLTSAGAAATR